jgi:hypothetical protein
VQKGKDHLHRAAGCIQFFGRMVIVECARTVLDKTYNMHFVGSWRCINVGLREAQTIKRAGRK